MEYPIEVYGYYPPDYYDRQHKLYGLFDLSDNSRFMYIGYTTMLMTYRINNHASAAKRSPNTKRDVLKWFTYMKENNRPIGYALFDEGLTLAEAREGETALIDWYRSQGVKLLNNT